MVSQREQLKISEGDRSYLVLLTAVGLLCWATYIWLLFPFADKLIIIWFSALLLVFGVITVEMFGTEYKASWIIALIVDFVWATLIMFHVYHLPPENSPFNLWLNVHYINCMFYFLDRTYDRVRARFINK